MIATLATGAVAALVLAILTLVYFVAPRARAAVQRRIDGAATDPVAVEDAVYQGIYGRRAIRAARPRAGGSSPAAHAPTDVAGSAERL